MTFEGQAASEGVSFVGAVTIPVIAMLLGAILVAAWRMVHGPTLADRVVALDMLAAIALAVTAVAALLAGHTAYSDVCPGLALFCFLGTVAVAPLVQASTRRSRVAHYWRSEEGRVGK